MSQHLLYTAGLVTFTWRVIDSHMCFESHVRAVVRACNCHTRTLRHTRKQLTSETAQTICPHCYWVPDRLLQLAAVLRSCCSYQVTKGAKQRRSCHLSAAQTRQCQTTVEVIALAPDTTAYPVQGSRYHIQGFVDI